MKRQPAANDPRDPGTQGNGTGAPKWEAVFDAVGEAVCVLDHEYRIRRCNRAMAEFLGLEKDSLIGRPCWEVCHGAAEPVPECPVTRLRGSLRKETSEMRLGDRWCEVIAEPYFDDQGGFRGAVHVIRDITKRREVAEELHVKDLAIRSSINAIAMSDLEGRLTYVNPAFLALWGYQLPDEVLGRHATEFWTHGEQAASVIHALMERGSWFGGLTARRRDGSVGPVELSASLVTGEDGRPVGLMASFVDVGERKKAEAALRESEEHLRQVIASIADGVVLQDRSGAIVASNPSAERILGLTREQLLGRTSLDPRWRTVREDGTPFPGETHPAMVTLRSGKPQHDVIMGVHKPDDHLTWVSVNSQLVAHGPGEVVVTFRDVSLQKRMEEELRQSEARYRDLVENASVWIWETDSQLRHVYSNAFVTACLGYGVDEFLATDILDLVHPDDRGALEEVARRALEQGQGWSGQVFRWRHRDGFWRHVESSGTAVFDPDGTLRGLRGIDHDVSERRHAEDELRRSADLLRESQAVARLGTYVLDIATGIWQSSEILDLLFGIDGAYVRDVAGWLELVHPEHRADLGRYFAEDVLRDRGIFDREYRIVRPSDGQVRWVHGRGRLDLDAGGNPVRMIGTIQDITELKRAEAERLDLERRLLHAQKLESLGILAGGIAHDFNNLLMAIMGNLDIARRRLSPVSPASQSLKQALQATYRAADLTRQMLAYSGRGMFVIKRVNLSELVEENAHLLRAAVPKNAVLAVHPQPSLPYVEADIAQLQQVVLNLITNAAEAVDGRPGTITLTTGVLEADDAYLRRSRADEVPPAGTYAYVEVSDTGCGMDAETQQRLFDPFFSTKALGRGLGMSAILGIVRGHRGAILVDSAPGEGTTIRVLFPAAAPAQDEGRHAQGEAAAVRAPGRRTVLLVDDEEMVRSVTREILEELGMDVLTANDGDEALARYRQDPSAVDAVLMDLSMPNMDGVTASREMLEIKPDAKIILVSGYHEQEMAGRTAGESIAAFLQKPYTVKGLRAALGRVLAEGEEKAGTTTR